MHRTRIALWLRCLSFVCLALLVARCGKDLTGPASGTFTAVYTNTLKKACIECHVPTGAATTVNEVQLDFSTQALAYSTLTTKNVTGAVKRGTCPGVKIVKASDPTNSYLAAVLFTDYSKDGFGGVTGCTPYNEHHISQNLSAAEKTSMLDWIRNGAKND